MCIYGVEAPCQVLGDLDGVEVDLAHGAADQGLTT